MTPSLRAVIADDERLARQKLRVLLESEPGVDIVAECQDGRQAVAAIREHKPDVVFLDVRMPHLDGFCVLEKIPAEELPAVVFTTAYDQYAVKAFEANAMDYLLKPFGRGRLERVMRRAQAALNASAPPLLARARESLQQAQRLSRIFVRDGDRIVAIPLATVERAQGADDYVTIYTAAREYLVSIRLSDLEGQLTGEKFLRIHRSHLVNLEHVSSIEPHDSARVQVVMKGGARIIASRAGSKRLRSLAL